MKRLLTAAVGVPLALAAIFRLPAWGFFVVCAALMTGAAVEYARLARGAAPGGPFWAVPAAVPFVAGALTWLLVEPSPLDGFAPLALAAASFLVVGPLVLLARTPVGESFLALGGIAFGVPYFAVPVAALVRLQQHDPWVLFLLLAIVWLGDTAAYYVGTRFGRHKLAPVVSPKKSWEGAAAGFATSLGSVVVWSLWREGRVDLVLLAIGAATAVASQIGDLVESVVKRGAGVKDSGGLLPGHGGLWDRMDAMLFAAPAMLLLLWAAGLEGALESAR
jgi:phosphatidate cytidylyltransferase